MNETGSRGYISADAVPRFVYFVEMGGFIKIGSSSYPKGRISHLQTGFPNQLRELLVVPFTVITESEAHTKFAHLRARREWFEAEPELVEYIVSLGGKRAKSRKLRTNLAYTPEKAVLLDARNSAIALRKLPGFQRIGAMLVENLEYQLRAPDDPDHRAAGARLYRELERQLGRAA